jgi:hypothetical protein
LVLLRCRDGSYRVLRLSRRRETSVASPVALDSFDTLGRYWMAGSNCRTSDPADCTRVYLNWRTGERRTFGEQLDSATHRDLDNPALPVARRPTPTQPLPQREGDAVLSAGGEDGADLILRVGRSRLVLSRCPNGCLYARLLRGVVTWSHGSGTVAYAYDVAAHRRFRWKFEPIVTEFGERVLVHHTRYEILVLVAKRLDAVGNTVYHLYARRLPLP